jgi:hypothetical protein
MRKTFYTRLFTILLLLSVFILIPLLAAANTDFCADIETRTKEGRTAPMGHICIKGEKIRHEMKHDGQVTIIISRPDKGVAWTLMTQQKRYLEMPIDKAKDDNPANDWTDDYQLLRKEGKKLGTETVNGIKCNKYLLKTEDGTITYWIMKSAEIPVRILAEDGTEVNYKNIKTGAIPDSLFEIPPGYSKFNLPGLGGMMQKMMQSLGGGQGGGGMPLPAR